MPLFLIPIMVMVLAQSLKMPHIYRENKKITLTDLASYGGFPSSHSAMAASVATLALLVTGMNSIAFAIAATFAIFIFRDAIGLRRQVGRYAVAINKLVGHKKFPEVVGHTPYQVLGGIAFGTVVTWLVYYIWIG